MCARDFPAPISDVLAMLTRRFPTTHRATRRQAGRGLVTLVIGVAVAASAWSYWQEQQVPAVTSVEAGNSIAPPQSLGADEIALSRLPAPGPKVYAQILQGGPFAFDKDGSVFGNYEGHLPKQARGYYREYTVAYAHRSRGAKRIVCGGTVARQPADCFYTADHYNSFRRIVVD